MDLVQILERLNLPNVHPVYARGIAYAENENLFNQYQVDTDLRRAHFLAMVLHETQGLQRLYENMNYSEKRILEVFGRNKHSAAVLPAEAKKLAMNPQALAERVYGLGNPRKAKELGNINPGDAWKFRGTGPLNLTGGKNFKAVSRETGIDFYSKPELAVDPKYVFLPSLHFWKRNSLAVLADKNDLRAITKKVNGGYNGFSDRQFWFNKVWKAINTHGSGSVEPAWKGASPDIAIKRLQQDLNTLGADPKLTVDGKMGPRTEYAIRKFQQDNGLIVDGIPGPITLATVKARLQGSSAGAEPTTHEQLVKKPKDRTGAGTTLIGLGVIGEYLISQVEMFRSYLPDSNMTMYIVSGLLVLGLALVVTSKLAQLFHKRGELVPVMDGDE